MVTQKTKIYNYFIGIDVSRNELDIAVNHEGKLLYHKEINNVAEEILVVLKELKLLPKFRMSKAVFCMEYTGIYCNIMLNTLKKIKANIVQENALHIKNSLGNIRGKYDKVDAIRIASYAFKNRHELRLWVPRRPIVQQLADYSSLRTRLVTVQTALRQPLTEQKHFIKKGLFLENSRLCNRSIEAAKADIIDLDIVISSLIESDTYVHRLFKIITSVPSIGSVTAIQIIICTNEFKDITTAKKFACYAGVAPFQNESGVFVKRAKVSKMANKKMKSLLHMCAMVSLRCDVELKTYYQRKVDEGKAKMLVINAMRYKLLLRIFACLNQIECMKKRISKDAEMPVVNP